MGMGRRHKKEAEKPATTSNLTSNQGKRIKGRWKWASKYELTVMQWHFVRNYISNGGNGGEAYSSIPGVDVTYGSAAAQASAWLNDPKFDYIQGAIQEALQESAEQAMVTCAKLIIELTHMATADVGDLYDDDGQLIPIKDLPIEIRKSIAEIKDELIWAKGTDGETDYSEPVGSLKKVKLHSKQQAINAIAKLLPELNHVLKVEHSGPNGSPIPVATTDMTEQEATQLYMDAVRGKKGDG